MKITRKQLREIINEVLTENEFYRMATKDFELLSKRAKSLKDFNEQQQYMTSIENMIVGWKRANRKFFKK